MQENLWEVRGWKGWKGGRGRRGLHGEPDGEGEAWDVDGWGTASWNGSSYMVKVFLELSISGVQSPPLAQHTLPIYSTASVMSLQDLQAVWSGLSSEPWPYLFDWCLSGSSDEVVWHSGLLSQILCRNRPCLEVWHGCNRSTSPLPLYIHGVCRVALSPPANTYSGVNTCNIVISNYGVRWDLQYIPKWRASLELSSFFFLESIVLWQREAELWSWHCCWPTVWPQERRWAIMRFFVPSSVKLLNYLWDSEMIFFFLFSSSLGQSVACR